jgi:hypothetical protein
MRRDETNLPVLHNKQVAAFGYLILAKDNTAKSDSDVLSVHFVLIMMRNDPGEMFDQ